MNIAQIRPIYSPERLRMWLKKNSYTYQSFSEVLGVSRNTLHKYLFVRVPPKATRLAVEYITSGEVHHDEWHKAQVSCESN